MSKFGHTAIEMIKDSNLVEKDKLKPDKVGKTSNLRGPVSKFNCMLLYFSLNFLNFVNCDGFWSYICKGDGPSTRFVENQRGGQQCIFDLF